MSTACEYYVIYAISKDDFRIFSDKQGSIVFFRHWEEANDIKEQLKVKHPDVNYHIRLFKFEDKFLKEYCQN